MDLAPALAQARPKFDAAWDTVLSHGQFVGGPEVDAFESAFAQFCGAERCVGVGNGTDAIELVLAGLGIGPGSEVIVPANTFIATAAAVHRVGAVPRFVDVDKETLLLSAEAARDAIGPRTAAIIAVHLFGQPCELDELSAVADAHSLVLIEDAAQAHDATYKGTRIGGHSAAATFSFYPGKNLGAFGDGGAVVTNDAALADRIASLSAHGRSPEDRYMHMNVGRNSRLDTLNSAMLSVRLGGLPHETARRREVRGWYEEMMPDGADLVSQRVDCESAYHLLVAQVQNRDDVRAELDLRGVGTGVHYPIPCHLQPAFEHLAPGQLPVVEAAADRIVSLPMGSHLDRSDVEYVCEQLGQVLISL